MRNIVFKIVMAFTSLFLVIGTFLSVGFGKDFNPIKFTKQLQKTYDSIRVDIPYLYCYDSQYMNNLFECPQRYIISEPISNENFVEWYSFASSLDNGWYRQFSFEGGHPHLYDTPRYIGFWSNNIFDDASAYLIYSHECTEWTNYINARNDFKQATEENNFKETGYFDNTRYIISTLKNGNNDLLSNFLPFCEMLVMSVYDVSYSTFVFVISFFDTIYSY